MVDVDVDVDVDAAKNISFKAHLGPGSRPCHP